MRYTISLVLLAAAPAFSQQRFAQPQRGEGSLPAFFIPNLGQTDPSVRFMVDTPELRAGFTATAAIFQLDGFTLRAHFANANAHPVVEGVERLSAQANFLIGDRPQDWHTKLPVYQKILYRDLYPGIDMSYGGAGHRIKSEFLVAPGADPTQIRLDYSGASLSIAANGDLLIHMGDDGGLGDDDGNAEAREAAPVIYQEIATGGRVEIRGRYLLLDAHTVGFEIAAYDRWRPLIIDPVLSYATYLGGSGMGAVTGVAVDSSGDLYATGWTESLNFQIAGPIQASNAGGVDAFVAKLTPAGSGLVYATYIGGRGDDRGQAIAVDGAGQAYVTGSTASNNFPLAAAIQPSFGGGRDAFALKLNALGSMLLYSTYLGGVNTDTGNAIAVDSSGNAYIAGDTLSANFPVRGAEQSALAGSQNVFVTKLSSAGGVVFSTFLGGSMVDHAGGIALDSGHNVYVAGGTTSTNFPVVGAIQAVNGGYQDAFLTKLNSAGSAIVYSTYLGGSGGETGTPEQANAVAVDASGSAYIAGATNSVNFPVTAGAFQTSYNAVEAAFAAKVNPAGNALVYSTYLGGSGFNWANGLAVAADLSVYVAGYTSSFDFPTAAPVQASFNGLYDAFVSVFNAAGNGLSFSTYYGGSGSDEANAIAVDSSGNMYLGGQTSSIDLTLLDPVQSTNIGYALGWLARLGVAGVAAAPLQFYPLTPCRIADTRASQGFAGALGPPALAAYADRNFPILSSACSIPSAAQAYSLNFTVVPDGPLGFLSVWPAGDAYPGVSTLNSTDGSVIANAAIVPAGAGGSITVVAGNPTDLIIDINGYFAAPGASGLDFFPLTPCRIADTRSTQGFTGAFGPPSLSAYAGRDFPLATSPCLSGSEQAYSLNVTVVPPAPLGFLSIWPVGQPYPGVSTLNSPDGTALANAAIVPAGTGGDIEVLAGNPTDVILDINGKFAAPGTGGLQFYTVTPCRVADTRTGQGFTGAFGPPSLAAYSGRNFPIQSSPCGIPSTAQAYALNMTVVPQGTLSFLSAWPTGDAYPGVSTLNSPDGFVIANAAIVPAGASGGITVLAGNPTDLIIDIVGYFAP